MASRRFYVVLEFDNDGFPGMKLPDAEKVASALAHSTCGEALMEAIGVGVCASVLDEAQQRLVEGSMGLLQACKDVVAWFDADFPKATAMRNCRAAIDKAERGA